MSRKAKPSSANGTKVVDHFIVKDHFINALRGKVKKTILCRELVFTSEMVSVAPVIINLN
jgi:hypothetical protein